MTKYVKLNPDKPSSETKRILDFLHRNVIGQKTAVSEITDLVSVAQAGLSDPNKPAGVFLLLGPTGTGKTHMVEKLAEALHGSPLLIKINGGEFVNDHETAKILGAPPGYLGHRETQPIFTQKKLQGKITELFPYTIILIDEIEKASSSLQKVLLNIFDRGKLSLGDGTDVNFSKCLFFMTSNLGAKELNRLLGGGMGIAPGTISTSAAHAGALTTTKKYFSPEFFNRIDKTITFAHLEHTDLLKILALELNKVEVRGGGRFYLKPTPQFMEWLVGKGYDKEYGARHLRRAVEQHVTLPLAKCLNSGLITRHAEVIMRISADAIEFKIPATHYSGYLAEEDF
jgi:hypothetical protein